MSDFTFPSAYSLGHFEKIEVLDVTGELVLFVTSSKDALGRWLCENNMIVTSSEPLEVFEPEIGTVCVFNAVSFF